MHVVYRVAPEAGCIGEGGSNDTETVSIEHDANELYHQSKGHLSCIECTDISISHRGEGSRSPVERDDIVVDSSWGSV